MRATIRYRIQIENGIKRTQKNFENEVKKILTDKRSWPINFIQDQENYDFVINLSKATTVANICSFKGLSCADRSNNNVYINNYRWVNGSKPSKHNIKDYRCYCILHETAHLLLLDHQQPEAGKLCPVMTQQTLGIGKAKKNCWPTKEEIELVNSIWNQN